MENHSFDRFNEKPPRRERRDDRFSDRPRRPGDCDDRFSDRPRRSEDRPFRFGGDRPRFGDRTDRPFDAREDRGDRAGRGGFGRVPRRDFGSRSGPRAKVVDRRRFTDHKAFVNSCTVRLDADVAEYFKNSQVVNDALRQLIALSALVKKNEVKEATVEVDEEVAEATTQDTEVEESEFISEDSFADTTETSDSDRE